jgi:hypothetical protein
MILSTFSAINKFNSPANYTRFRNTLLYVDQKHNQFLENRTAGKKERLKELCSLVGYKYEKFHNRLDGWLSSFSTFFFWDFSVKLWL